MGFLRRRRFAGSCPDDSNGGSASVGKRPAHHRLPHGLSNPHDRNATPSASFLGNQVSGPVEFAQARGSRHQANRVSATEILGAQIGANDPLDRIRRIGTFGVDYPPRVPIFSFGINLHFSLILLEGVLAIDRNNG
jgi:hypothetical protein